MKPSMNGNAPEPSLFAEISTLIKQARGAVAAPFAEIQAP